MKIIARFSGLARLGALMGASFLSAVIFSSHTLLADEEKKSAIEESATEEDDAGKYRNWVELSIGGLIYNGDRAQFQQRTWIPNGVFGGIEDLHWEQDVGKKALFTFDARAIYDSGDYLAKFELSQPDLGFIRGGFRQFRTWYDGNGGFFPNPALPGGGQFFPPDNDDLHIDRGEFWFEAGLRLPDFPEITFSYFHLYRYGQKDSTIWGDTGLTGLPGPNNIRSIVPTFLNIDERRDLFTLDIEQSFSNTNFGLGFRYETMDNSDTTNIHRRPGEAGDRYLTQREDVQADLFNIRAFVETRYGEKLWFSTGYSFTSMDTNIGGSRIYGATYDAVYDPLFARRQQRDEGFFNLGGGSQFDQHVVNANVMWIPWEHLSIVSAFRYERQNISSVSSFIETDVLGGATRLSVQDELNAQSEWDYWNTAESLELRFTGIPNLLLYARGEWAQENGNLQENEFEGMSRLPVLFRNTDNTLVTQKYLVGINWYPLQRVNISAQYYHKSRANSYDHLTDSTPNPPPSPDRYPAYLIAQDFVTDDVNVRLTLRPCGSITLVTRYDFQFSTINSKAGVLADVRSAETTTQIFSQSFTWTPLARLYIQGNFHYVLDETNTPAAAVTPSVQNAQNDYWNADLTIGLALDDKTSLQLSYFYYRANNYDNNYLFGQPYGAGAEEQAVSVTFGRQITRNLRWNLKYGFFTNHDQTSGGRNDYNAHLIYSSLAFRF